MPKFSQLSINRLSTCHPDLQEIFNEVIKHFDCIILEGHRGKAAQDKAYADGKSQVKWPDGKHNKTPSMAVDAIPYPVNWNDINHILYFGGFVMGAAKILKAEGKISHDVRYGGDWDMDTKTADNSFNDLVHFELVDKV